MARGAAGGDDPKILHIVDSIITELARRGAEGGKIALLVTEGTARERIYQGRLAAQGFSCIVPEPDGQAEVMRAIHLVKAGAAGEAGAILRREAKALIAVGCRQIVMGCTEIPIAMEQAETGLRGALIDATEALARLAIEACGKSLAR